MKSSTLIVWLLVAACIAIDLAMIGEIQIRRNEWPEAGGVVGLGLVFSQIAIIALWAVCGRIKVLIRGVSALLAVWAISYLASYSVDGHLRAANMWFGILMFDYSVCLIPFIIARFRGCAIADQESTEHQKLVARLSTKQFSIGGILSLMTAIGITLTAVRFAEFPIEDMMQVVALFTTVGVTSCTILLLAVFVSRVRYAIITAIVICPVSGILLSFAHSPQREALFEFVLMMYVQGVSTLSVAAVLRSAGYRLVRHTQARQATVSGSSGDCESATESPFAEP